MHKACFLASARVSSACVTVLLRLTFPRLSSVHISKQLETCSALLLKARLTQCFLLAPDRFTPCPAFAHAHAFQEWVHALGCSAWLPSSSAWLIWRLCLQGTASAPW